MITAPSDLLLRPRGDADRVPLRALCSAALSPEDAAEPDDLERVLWSSGTFSTVAERGGELIGAVVGTTLVEDDGLSAAVTIVGTTLVEDDGLSAAVTIVVVASEHRRQGVGSALLARFEEEGARSGAGSAWSGGGQPRFWWPGIHEQDDDVIAFFTANGYRHDDIAPNLDVDLRRADLSERDMGDIDIHRLDPTEWTAFAAWMKTTWDEPWDGETEATLLRNPVSCHVAMVEGRYVGFAAYDTNHVGWFGPMGTDPKMRGSGLGAEMLRRCLRDYVARGETQCEIGWVGPAEFYTKVVGATAGQRFVRMRKDL